MIKSRSARLVDLFQPCRIQDSTLFGLIGPNEIATLRFDLYHRDDDERCQDDTGNCWTFRCRARSVW